MVQDEDWRLIWIIKDQRKTFRVSRYWLRIKCGKVWTPKEVYGSVPSNKKWPDTERASVSKKCLSQEHKATAPVSVPTQSSADYEGCSNFGCVSTAKQKRKISSTYKQGISLRCIFSRPARRRSMAVLHSVVLDCYSVLSSAGFHRRRFYHKCSMKSMMTILHWLLRVHVLWLEQKVSWRCLKSHR